MATRLQTGDRNHLATFVRHNGRQHKSGEPTLDVPGDWLPVVVDWFCSLVTTSGGEQVRGQQVTAQTTHVLIGDYLSADGIKPSDRCRVAILGNPHDLLELEVVSAVDTEGTAMLMRVECKREG